MQSPAEFRLLVLFNLLLIPAAWMVAGYDAWLLPPQLQAWVAGRGSMSASAVQSLAGSVGFFAFVALCLGLVGMLAFWRWARALTLWSTVVIYLPLPLGGPVVISGFAYTFEAVAAILWGVLLACAYWSPAAAGFATARRLPATLSRRSIRATPASFPDEAGPLPPSRSVAATPTPGQPGEEGTALGAVGTAGAPAAGERLEPASRSGPPSA